jgi:hypothetical protein
MILDPQVTFLFLLLPEKKFRIYSPRIAVTGAGSLVPIPAERCTLK